MADARVFDPERLVTTLAAEGVRYVLVGALAARLQGFPRLTADADITPSRAPGNLDRLAAALTQLDARIYTESVPEGLPFDWDASQLRRGDIWNLITSAGRLDVAFVPNGTAGFDDLMENALRFEAFGAELYVADLADIIRSKQAADRPQDRQDVLVMQEMLRRRAE